LSNPQRPGARTLFLWILWSAFRAQPGRWLAAGFTVAIGLSLAVAIHVVNRSALTEFGRALDVVNGQASAQIQSLAGDFDDRWFDEIEARRSGLGIASISPVLLVQTDKITVLGLDLFRAAGVTPALMPSVATGRRDDLFAGDAIFLSEAALRDMALSVGDRIALRAGPAVFEFRIAGTVAGVTAEPIAVMDLGLAQWRFERPHQISRLDLRLAPGASVSKSITELSAVTPGLVLLTAQNREQRMSNLSRAYRVNLFVLALVALFTGAFLVFTAVSFSVLRQQSQLALLGVLGASRRWLMALVMSQGLLVCALGGALGLGLGLGLAKGLLTFVGGDLGAGFFSKKVVSLEVSGLALLGFWLLALLVGLVAGFLPARAAARRAPIEQLRQGAAERMLSPLISPWLAIALGALSLGLAFAPAIDGLPIAGYAAIACLLLAGIAATPWVVKWIFSVVLQVISSKHAVNSSAVFAIWRIAQAPAGAAGLIAGVVAAVSLTVAMVVMVASFRDSVAQWLDQILPADLYTTSQRAGHALDLDPNTVLQIAQVKGVMRSELSRQQSVLVEPGRPEVTVIARPLPRENPSAGIPLTGPMVESGKRPMVFISEAMRDLYGWQPGGTYAITLSSTLIPTQLYVAGVYRDYGRQHGSIMMNIDDFSAITGDLKRTSLAVWLTPDAQPDQVLTDLQQQVPALRQAQFMSAADIRSLSLKIFDRSFTLTYALELAALLVAIFSVATGFAGQALIRKKEFALMSHLGQSRRQRRAVIATESLSLLTVAVVWGSLLGLLMSQILIHRVNPQSFHWTMEISVPVTAILALSLAVVFVGAGAALWAAGRGLAQSRLSAALKEDW
jgi:putative ABC transport system permease protein